MTARTRSIIVAFAATFASLPPVVLWFVAVRVFAPGITADSGWLTALALLIFAFLAPGLAFVFAYLAANYTHNLLAPYLKWPT